MVTRRLKDMLYLSLTPEDATTPGDREPARLLDGALEVVERAVERS